MIYSQHDFLQLEKLGDNEVRQEIVQAKENFQEAQETFAKLERDMEDECKFLKPDLNILFKNLKNIESYIRKAENLLAEWDSNRFIDKARNRRNKYKTFSLIKVNLIGQ